jgi:hypothetical protein
MAGLNFESKVADLVAVTRRLEVPQILLLRRLTLIDPETLKWANVRQLELIFTVILGNALERAGLAAIQAASTQHFDPLLPSGSEEDRDKERWLLFDLAKPMLSGKVPAETGTTEDLMDQLEEAEEDFSAMSFGDFPTLFDESIARYIRRTLLALAVTGSRPHIPPPFFVAPAFAACFDRVLRTSVLPAVRNTRRVRELAGTRNWTEEGAGARLIGMVQSQDSGNPILHHWHTRWTNLHPDTILKGKDGKPRARLPEEDPWPAFKEDAAKTGYIPPTPADIPMLDRLLRLDGEVLAVAWETLAQLYEQEFHPKARADQGRPGSFRDGLIAQMERLDRHGGDLLVIKAFFDLPKVDRLFVKQLIQTLGRTDIERERKAPLLSAFYNDLPK